MWARDAFCWDNPAGKVQSLQLPNTVLAILTEVEPARQFSQVVSAQLANEPYCKDGFDSVKCMWRVRDGYMLGFLGPIAPSTRWIPRQRAAADLHGMHIDNRNRCRNSSAISKRGRSHTVMTGADFDLPKHHPNTTWHREWKRTLPVVSRISLHWPARGDLVLPNDHGPVSPYQNTRFQSRCRAGEHSTG